MEIEDKCVSVMHVHHTFRTYYLEKKLFIGWLRSIIRIYVLVRVRTRINIAILKNGSNTSFHIRLWDLSVKQHPFEVKQYFSLASKDIGGRMSRL